MSEQGNVTIRWDEKVVKRYDLDVGDGHYLRWVWRRWEGERPSNERPVAADVAHAKPDAPHGFCEGSITFDISEAERSKVRGGRPVPLWQVQSWEPLTLSPSLLCHCGDHGFIRAGRWVRA